jgi:hypothetical protein
VEIILHFVPAKWSHLLLADGEFVTEIRAGGFRFWHYGIGGRIIVRRHMEIAHITSRFGHPTAAAAVVSFFVSMQWRRHDFCSCFEVPSDCWLTMEPCWVTKLL